MSDQYTSAKHGSKRFRPGNGSLGRSPAFHLFQGENWSSLAAAPKPRAENDGPIPLPGDLRSSTEWCLTAAVQDRPEQFFSDQRYTILRSGRSCQTGWLIIDRPPPAQSPATVGSTVARWSSHNLGNVILFDDTPTNANASYRGQARKALFLPPSLCVPSRPHPISPPRGRPRGK